MEQPDGIHVMRVCNKYETLDGERFDNLADAEDHAAELNDGYTTDFWRKVSEAMKCGGSWTP